MPVSDEVFKSAMDQLKNTELSAKAPEPVAPEKEKRAEQGGSFVKSVGEAGKDLASRFAKGVQGGDEFIKAMIYGVAGPLIPEKGVAGDIAGKIMRPINIGGAKERAEHPKTMAGKVLGGAAEGVGGIASMPILGGNGVLARNIIVGMGMGEGADIGKNVMGGLFGYFAGPQGRKAGEEAGQILGGAAGAQLNVTRVKALGEAFSQVGGGLKSIGPAFKSAQEKNAAAMAAGDKSNLWGLFADEFGSLRAQTKGIIADFTQRNIAAAIRKDIRASAEAEKFVADSQTTGIYQRPWGLAERTMVPTLTETVASVKPESYSQASDIAERARKMQRSIVFAYNKMVKGAALPATANGIEASANAMRDMTQAKVDALSNEAGNVKNAFRRLDINQEASLGDTARNARDKLRDEAFDRGSKMYQDAEVMAGENRAIVSPEEVRSEGAQILKDFYSKVRPEEVPPVIRNMMSATKAEGKAASGLILPKEVGAERAVADAAKEQAGKPLTLKEANDLYKAFGEAAETARSSENHVAAQSARALQSKLRESIEKSDLPDNAKQAWNAAVENWRTDYAERFQQGLGKALGKERGGVMQGREVVPDEKVIDEALAGPTPFQEWEITFKNDPRANLVLQAGLEDRFRKQVMDKTFNAERFEESVDKFREKYAPGLDKFPQVREKIDAKAAELFKLENEKKMELDRYKDLMKADITKEIGPVQAKQFFETILSDPMKMKQTLALQGVTPKRLVKEIFQQANPFKAGEYDPDGIRTLLESGTKVAGSPSSMQILFDKAFGDQGKRHMDTLAAIGRFTERQAMTDPRYLQANSILTENPVQKATGQKMASWISAIRTQAAGNTSRTYVATLGLSRFANAKVQAAVDKAKHEALYNPETAQAILEMAGKDASQPLSMTTAKKIFGNIKLSDGQLLIDKMIDKGFVDKHISRGIIYGLQKIEQDREDPNNRETARRMRATQ